MSDNLEVGAIFLSKFTFFPFVVVIVRLMLHLTLFVGDLHLMPASALIHFDKLAQWHLVKCFGVFAFSEQFLLILGKQQLPVAQVWLFQKETLFDVNLEARGGTESLFL